MGALSNEGEGALSEDQGGGGLSPERRGVSPRRRRS